MLTMRPRPRGSISASARLQPRKTPVRSMSITRRQVFSSVSSTLKYPSRIPALLTMTSSGPRAAMAPLTARFSSSDLLVSPWKALACPPAFLIWLAVASADAPSRSIAATGEPFAARASAMARPMPEPAPVTIAILVLVAIDSESPSPSPQCGQRRIVRVLDRHGVAVSAWVRAAHQGAGFWIARDALPAAHHPRPVVDHVDLMPALDETGSGRIGNAGLGVEQALAVDAHARLLDGLLDVVAELERVEQHLWLGLQDAVGARSAHAQHEHSVLEDLDRRHHGAGLSPRLDHVRRGRVEVHPLEDVVEHEPRAGHGEPRAEGDAERLCDRHDRAVSVCAGKVSGLLVLELCRIDL